MAFARNHKQIIWISTKRKPRSSRLNCAAPGLCHFPRIQIGNDFSPTVSLHFSSRWQNPFPVDYSTSQARAKLTAWLRDQQVRQQFVVEMDLGAKNLYAAVEETAGHKPRFRVLEDVPQQPLTYRKLMVGADVMAHALRNRVADDEHVGLLLPTVNAMPVTMLALWSLGKVPGHEFFHWHSQLAGLRETRGLKTADRFAPVLGASPAECGQFYPSIWLIHEMRKRLTER